MFEIVTTMVGNVPEAVVASVAAGFLRNLAGWVENAWKDGKIDAYEAKQLAGTVVKYFAGVMLLMLGFPIEESVAIFFGLDIGTSAIKKIGTNNK